MCYIDADTGSRHRRFLFLIRQAVGGRDSDGRGALITTMRQTQLNRPSDVIDIYRVPELRV